MTVVSVMMDVRAGAGHLYRIMTPGTDPDAAADTDVVLGDRPRTGRVQ